MKAFLRDNPIILFFFTIFITLGIAFLLLVLCAIIFGPGMIAEQARIDQLCAKSGFLAHQYEERRGKTILSKRMCIDTKTGQIFDPDFMGTAK